MNTVPLLPIRLVNPLDTMRVARGEMNATNVRMLETKAIVDMRVRTLVVPTQMANALGLQSAPLLEVHVFDRTSTFESDQTTDNNTSTMPILGRIPFSFFDLVFDAEQQRYAPSPKNGGRWVVDCVSVF